MMKIIIDALRAGRATVPMPEANQGFAASMFGRPALANEAQLAEAMALCPTEAISVDGASAIVDDGRCVSCGLCTEGPRPAFTSEAAEPMIALERGALRRRFPIAAAGPVAPALDDGDRMAREGGALSAAVRARFGRSAHIRHISAGGCNGCEWELNQLNAPVYDLQRFGYDFVASPRHADILLVTGVVTRNLELALVRTLDAMPRPRMVLAMGACAISGGVFRTSYASCGGADRVVAVDAYVAGCPPRPWAVLRGLRLLLEG